jgi:hypothetical protein
MPAQSFGGAVRRVSLPQRLLVSFCLVTSFTAGWVSAATRTSEHVIHISVDGLHPGHMQAVIDAGQAPNLKRFQDEGAWTTNGRTDYTYTVTLPNHTAMLTGRPVTQPEGMPETVHHGWTDNKDPDHGTTLHNSGNPHVKYMASVFDVAHDAGLSTAMYNSKGKFMLYDQSYNETHGAAHEHGRDKIDTYFSQSDGAPSYSAGMNERFLADMAAKHFNYVFVHYRDTDSVGHALSWGSSAWRQAIIAVDGYLGGVFRLVESDPQLAGKTTILLTADHGGIWFDHGDPTLADNYTVPVFAWGTGVSRGDLYAMNVDTRTDPGDGRVDFNSASQPIRNGDTGNLALSLLGLGPIPGSLINVKQNLRVSLAGDYNLDGTVDAADYTVWKDTEGSQTDLRADGNGDGVVDEADQAVWKANSGRTSLPVSPK